MASDFRRCEQISAASRASTTLSVLNAGRLRGAFEQWASPARKVGRISKGKSKLEVRTAADKEQVGVIREWARKSGYDVSSRGRISADVVAAYNKAS